MNDAPAGAAPRPEASRRLLRNPFFWAAVTGVLTITALRPVLRHIPEPPPPLGAVADYRFLSVDGEPFGSRDLSGEVYVAVFLPPGGDDGLATAAGALAERLSAGHVDVRLVTVAIAPNPDASTLAALAERIGARPPGWLVLGATPPQAETLLRDGLPLVRPLLEGQPLDELAHALAFLLVDGEGRLRGSYGFDEMGVDEVFHRAQHVLRRGAP